MPINPWRRFDFLLLLLALALAGYGVMMIYSASLAGVAPGTSLFSTPYFRQALYSVIGVGLMLLIAAVDYRILASLTRQLYIGTLALLVLVFFLGEMTYGSRRWLDLGLFPLQPSEIGKLITIIALAKFLSGAADSIKSIRTFALSLLLMAPFMGMVFLQPDLGTVAIYICIWLGMIFVAGARFLHLLGLTLTGLASLPLLYEFALHDYMRDRLDTFIDPTKDALGAGYNVLQSTISVGSGGLFGKGWTQGSQTQLNFLRIQHTDFIFSVLGEEMGFVGGLALFVLFILLLLRSLRAAPLALDDFGRLLAVGVVVMILAQAFINIGVNVRLLPVTGVPLPFISYGGSSVMTIFASLGIIQSIVMRRDKMRF